LELWVRWWAVNDKLAIQEDWMSVIAAVIAVDVSFSHGSDEFIAPLLAFFRFAFFNELKANAYGNDYCSDDAGQEEYALN